MSAGTAFGPAGGIDCGARPAARDEPPGPAAGADSAVAAGSGVDFPSQGGWNLRGRRFEWGSRTYVMAVINVTPDSFSGDGLVARARREDGEAAIVARALELARGALEAGADVIDIGGESSRPGAQPVDAAEEADRVLPAIAAIRKALPEAVISVDTYKSSVASLALKTGADIVNDIWSLRADSEMAGTVARAGAPVILMHNRSRPADAEMLERIGGLYVGVEYADLVGEVRSELLSAVELALEAGIRPDRIALDPGIGFGKTARQNLELLDRTAEIRSLGYPVLVGTSRKSFIGMALDAAPSERVEGTAATVAVAIARGADMVRVHDVAEMVKVAKVADAIVRRGRAAGEQGENLSRALS